MSRLRTPLHREHQRLIAARFKQGLSPKEGARLATVQHQLDLHALAQNQSVLLALDALTHTQERPDAIQSVWSRVGPDNQPKLETDKHLSLDKTRFHDTNTSTEAPEDCPTQLGYP